ncbi:hypothetical protein GDO78_018132 [Eleutherodactylus coqui]|uniref:Uncharacterized protein n=1 Tax=Eleutherodactylus coqui TaxID=57060 RepID=A0A8J6BA39_ELECQ|nr:hypothetical protein GDO78_018132 [Eleutherodactylus coqui]
MGSCVNKPPNGCSAQVPRNGGGERLTLRFQLAAQTRFHDTQSQKRTIPPIQSLVGTLDNTAEGGHADNTASSKAERMGALQVTAPGNTVAHPQS